MSKLKISVIFDKRDFPDAYHVYIRPEGNGSFTDAELKRIEEVGALADLRALPTVEAAFVRSAFGDMFVMKEEGQPLEAFDEAVTEKLAEYFEIASIKPRK